MSRYTELTWYSISEAIPKADVYVLIRLQEDQNSIYKAKRINFESSKYGFLFVLVNDFKSNVVNMDDIEEHNSFCPASVIEWCYLTA